MTDRMLQAWALDCTSASAVLPPVQRDVWLPYEDDHTLFYSEETDEGLEEVEGGQNMTLTNAATYRTPTGHVKLDAALRERDSSGRPLQPLVEGDDEVGFGDSAKPAERAREAQGALRQRAAQRLASGTDSAMEVDLSKKPVGGPGGPIVPPGSDFDPNDIPALQEGGAERGGEEEVYAATEEEESAQDLSLTEAMVDELLEGIGEEEDWRNIA
jgi:hypothetical protein